MFPRFIPGGTKNSLNGDRKMKRLLIIAPVFAGFLALGCQQKQDPAASAGLTRPVTLVQGLGPVNHRVTTASHEAQQFFDQGLAYIYGFNHAEAIRSFEKAAELDPKLAMAWWGKSYALGPNINVQEIDR